MIRDATSFSLLCTLCLGGGLRAVQADNYVTTTIQATFKIANPGSTATCFLVACPNENDAGQVETVLVTAGHVLEKMNGDESRLILRKKQENGTYVRHEVTIKVRNADGPLWVKHANVDVAAMRLKLPEPSLVQPIPLDAVADAKSIREGLCDTGDEVRILTYPAQVEANGAGIPIVRRGIIASFPLAPVPAHRTFLVDFNSFAGDSGGPVLLQPPVSGDEASDQPHVVGLVIGQHMHEERYKLTYEETVVRHRLGVGIAVHAEFIRQTIELLRKQDEE